MLELLNDAIESWGFNHPELSAEDNHFINEMIESFDDIKWVRVVGRRAKNGELSIDKHSITFMGTPDSIRGSKGFVENPHYKGE